jgi:hypothetical protein
VRGDAVVTAGALADDELDELDVGLAERARRDRGIER